MIQDACRILKEKIIAMIMRIIQMSDLIALKIERILQVTSEAQNTPVHFSSFRTNNFDFTSMKH